MNRKLFLHVGPPKTGTSVIQDYFSTERRSNKLLYPKTGRWFDGSHHSLVFASRGAQKYGETEIAPWKLLTEQLKDEISSSEKDVLISSEAAQPSFVKELNEIIKYFSFFVTVVITLRTPLDRASSLYNQRVKDPAIGMATYPDEFLLQNINSFKTRPFWEKWRTCCDKIIVVPYHGQRPLVQRFCESIDNNYDISYKNPVLNRSMSGVGLLTMVLTNQFFDDESQRRQFFNYLAKNEHIPLWRGDCFPFSSKSCNEFIEHSLTDNQWIKDNLNISFRLNEKNKAQKFRISSQCISNIIKAIEGFHALTPYQRTICEQFLKRYI